MSQIRMSTDVHPRVRARLCALIYVDITQATQHGNVPNAVFGASQVQVALKCCCAFWPSLFIEVVLIGASPHAIPPGAPFCLSGEKAIFLKTCVLNDSSRLCCNCERQREQVVNVSALAQQPDL